MAAALLTTAACALDIVSPFSLYYSWTMVWDRGQFWRVFTNFFFFGAKFSLEFLFHMFFLVQYCRSLEEGSFRGRTADFAYMIMLGAGALTVVAPFAHMHFLGSSLSFMMVYLWARRNPFVRMSFLGLFTFTAPYLPWVLLGFSFLLGHDGQCTRGFGGDERTPAQTQRLLADYSPVCFACCALPLFRPAMADSLGIAIGHLYYFLEDVYPLMTPTRKRILKTPKIMYE